MRQTETVQTTKVEGFNPRTRKGCDDEFNRLSKEVERFNPRTRKGCDQKT